jgi:hypothetical protein
MRVKGAFDTKGGPMIIIQKWSFGFDRAGWGVTHLLAKFEGKVYRF